MIEIRSDRPKGRRHIQNDVGLGYLLTARNCFCLSTWNSLVSGEELFLLPFVINETEEAMNFQFYLQLVNVITPMAMAQNFRNVSIIERIFVIYLLIVLLHLLKCSKAQDKSSFRRWIYL